MSTGGTKLLDARGRVVNPATSDTGLVIPASGSTTLLGIGGIFTGPWIDCLNIAQIVVTIKSDKAGVMSLQRSSTGLTVGSQADYPYITLNIGLKNYFAVGGRYARIVYTNGAAAQTSFSLNTMVSRQVVGFTFQPLDQPQNDDAVSLNTIANLAGKRIDGVHSLVPLMNDNSLSVTSIPYIFAIAEGDVPDHSIQFKMGYSPASTAAETTLWNLGTQYVFPTGTISVEAVSSSAVDSDTLGTGTQTMHLVYLTIGYVEKEWTFIMDGVTPVAGPTDFFRVNHFHTKTGTRGAGTINLRLVGAPATIYSQQAAGSTRSRNSVYTVPIDKVYYVESVHFSAGYKTAGKTVRTILHSSVSPDGLISNTGLLFWPHFEAVLVDGTAYDPSDSPIKFPATTDIKVSVIGETLAQCTSRITGWLENA